MNGKVLITKMVKHGTGKTVGSAFGFGSWSIGGTSIEIELDPPLDITTAEGQAAYQKMKASLGKMTLRALAEDVALACQNDIELSKSIMHRELTVNRGLENNGD